jgi:hypothetical protein
MTDIEVTVNGKTYRGSYLFKPAAQGSGTVVVNYDVALQRHPLSVGMFQCIQQRTSCEHW